MIYKIMTATGNMMMNEESRKAGKAVAVHVGAPLAGAHVC